MALFRKLRNLKKAKAERSKERQKPKESAKQKPVASEAMLLAKGALGYPAFIEACERHGIRGNEKISVLFEQLYKWFSQSPALSALEAELELEAKIKNYAFDGAVVWADIMMANKLAPNRKIIIPGKYAETYRSIIGKKGKKQ